MSVITDQQMATVLRTFERRCAPMLRRLRAGEEPERTDEDGDVDTGPVRDVLEFLKDRISRIAVPGTAAWEQLPTHDRADWWVAKVGRLTALGASVTGLAGAVGDRFAAQDLLGSAGQGLLLCAIASEHGVDDPGTRVRMLAAVLFDRDIDPVVAAGTPAPVESTAEPFEKQHVGEQPDGEPPAEPLPSGKIGLRTSAKWLWTQGKLLKDIEAELGKRPQGRFYHRALGKVPVVGMAGDYFGERSALKRAAKAADRWLHRNAP